MSIRTTLLISLVVAIAVFVTGAAFSLLAPKQYQSTAAMILAPQPTDPDQQTNLLNSFERSGTMGSTVELLASDDLLRKAGDPDVDVGVRAVPQTRVITISAQGDENEVQPALTSIVRTAQTTSPETIRDLYDLKVLESASTPTVAGAPTIFMLAATIVLALLSALLTFVLLRRGLPAVVDALGAERRGVEDEDAVPLRRAVR